jgi:hypothetical protein
LWGCFLQITFTWTNLSEKNWLVQFKLIDVAVVSFTFIHNCVWIFLFIARNAKIPINFKNEFQRITKHVFWQYFFLHMWLALQTKHFEPIEHNFFIKWLFPFPSSPFLQNLKTLKFLYNLVFHQVHLRNIYFHKKGHVFVVQKVWNQLYDFMHSFWFIFIKNAI